MLTTPSNHPALPALPAWAPLPDRRTGFGITMLIVTPDMARELLGLNVENRPLSKGRVAKIARDLRNGKWRTNGDAIRVRSDGVLADGQHRLAACVESNVAFQTIVVVGLDKDDMLTVDTNRPRAAGDLLSIKRGVTNGRHVAAIIRNLIAFATQDTVAQPTNAEMDAIFERHPRITEAATATHGKNAGPGRPAILGALYFIAVHNGTVERAEAMMRVMQQGKPDYTDCAMHRLREMLIQARTGRGSGFSDLRHFQLYAAAWNKFVVMEPVKILRPSNDFRIRGWSETDLGVDLGREVDE